MITKKVSCEFGDFNKKINHGYNVYGGYMCIDAYVEPKAGEWSNCPCCGLTPKVWTYDNGRHTGCGCGNDQYNHFSVNAESIMSVYTRTNGKRMDKYNSDELMKNWNDYCATMINPCSHEDLQILGKW